MRLFTRDYGTAQGMTISIIWNLKCWFHNSIFYFIFVLRKRLYNLHTKNKKPNALPPLMLDLVKYFISSNTALQNINNPYFRRILHPDLELQCGRTLRDKTFPYVHDLLKAEIESRLKDALFVGLIPDEWKGTQMSEYLGRIYGWFFIYKFRFL
jgi:hypothetical protein